MKRGRNQSCASSTHHARAHPSAHAPAAISPRQHQRRQQLMAGGAVVIVNDPKISGKVADPKAQVKRARGARRAQVRMRVDKLRQSRQRSMFGLPELAGFAASLLILICAVFAYLYFLVPSYLRLSNLQRERTVLQEQLRGAQEGMTRNTDAQATVEEINSSVVSFENKGLPSRNEGRMSLYNTLNQIIRSNGVRNTSGPTYIALDPLVTNAQGQIRTT